MRSKPERSGIRIKSLSVLLVLFSLGMSACASRTERQLHVAAAASLAPAFIELSNLFTETTGERIVLTFSSTGALTEQIRNGAPFAVRKENRDLIGRYVEIYCKSDIDTLIRRDVKGLYARALKGEIKHFTGISDPYEEPEDAEIICETSTETVEESLYKILRTLELLGFIPDDENGSRRRDDEDEKIRQRLRCPVKKPLSPNQIRLK